MALGAFRREVRKKQTKAWSWEAEGGIVKGVVGGGARVLRGQGKLQGGSSPSPLTGCQNNTMVVLSCSRVYQISLAQTGPPCSRKCPRNPHFPTWALEADNPSPFLA